MVNTEVRDLPTFEQVPYTLYEIQNNLEFRPTIIGPSS